MKPLSIIAAAALSVLAFPLSASGQCVQITSPSSVASGEAWTLEWTPYPGANGYEVVTAFIDGSSSTVRRELVRQPRVTLMQIVTVPQRIRATVTPLGAPTVCHESVVVEIRPDETLREMSRRTIVPVVASAPGAFGARFRSSLTLGNVSGAPVSGRLVFHPAGQPYSDDHPSMPFSVDPDDSVSWADVVSAMGQEGIGSLDIIVDDASPESSQRRRELVTVASMAINDEGQAIFGANIPAYVPLEVSSHELGGQSENWYMTVPDPGADGRVNIGWRTIDLGTLDGPEPSVRFSLYRDGGLVTSVDLQLGENEMNQVPGAAVFGQALQPGDRITAMGRGTMILWLTWTSNSTNDPAFFPARRLRTTDPVMIPLLPDDTLDVIPHASVGEGL